MKPIAVLAAALALSLGSMSCQSEPAADSSAAIAPDMGSLPSFIIEDMAGRLVTNADLENKVALVNFWATWCAPCKVEMPWFVEFQRKYKDEGFVVLAISLDEDGWEPVRRFAEEGEFNFPVVLGDDALSEDFGGIHVLPTTLIVDRSGNIMFRHTGLVSKSTYEQELEALL